MVQFSRHPNTLAASENSQNVSNNSDKRKADNTLQSARKRTKTDEEELEPKLDVTVQTGLYAAEMFAANIAVKHTVNLVVVGVLFRLLSSMLLSPPGDHSVLGHQIHPRSPKIHGAVVCVATI